MVLEEQGREPEEQEGTDEFYEEIEILVDPGQGPLRIDRFLTDKLDRVSRNKVQNGIRSGAVLVNGVEIKSNYKVKPRDYIKVILPRSLDGLGKTLAQDIPLDIIYEDEDLIVVNKPAGMIVHPGIGNPDGTLVNALAFHLQDKDLPVMPGNIADRPGLVHRIDKDTSGLLVIAKSEYAMSHLAKQFFNHTIKRTYWALVWGEPEPREGTIEMNVGRHPRIRQQQEAFPDGDAGKPAITHYRMLESFYYVSLLECHLETGRTHQIRVHMKHQGHPLFSDHIYGGHQIRKGTIYSRYKQFVDGVFQVMPRHALHARTLGFVHPTKGIDMVFDSPLPDDFQQALDAWREWTTRQQS